VRTAATCSPSPVLVCLRNSTALLASNLAPPQSSKSPSPGSRNSPRPALWRGHHPCCLGSRRPNPLRYRSDLECLTSGAPRRRAFARALSPLSDRQGLERPTLRRRFRFSPSLVSAHFSFRSAGLSDGATAQDDRPEFLFSAPFLDDCPGVHNRPSMFVNTPFPNKHFFCQTLKFSPAIYSRTTSSDRHRVRSHLAVSFGHSLLR